MKPVVKLKMTSTTYTGKIRPGTISELDQYIVDYLYQISCFYHKVKYTSNFLHISAAF